MAELSALPATARYSLRGEAADIAAACAAWGLARPAPLHATTAAARAALWLGPDEVLLLAPEDTLAPAQGWCTDISQRQLGFVLEGAEAATVLAAGCPLDPARLSPGGCTRTLLGKAEIVLWRTAEDAWRIEVWRSFAGYVQALLAQAMRDWP